MNNKHRNVIIWGCGMLGGPTLNRCLEQGYMVLGFYDSDEKKHNTIFKDVWVLNQEQLIELCEDDTDIAIVCGTLNYQYVKEIEASVKEMFPLNTPTVIPQVVLASQYLEHAREEAKGVGTYKVDFEASIEIWLSSIMEEVEYWCKCASSPEANLMNRQKQNFDCKRVTNLIKPGDTVLDVGCGIFSKYGDCLEEGTINLIPVDSLAYFYKKINQVYCKELQNTEIKFGMLELMSEFFDAGSSDVVLIDNALDHCIDPYKSILECLHVVRGETGGCLSLRHRRAEGVVEYYTGLHNWNLDYNETGDFIIWNKDNYFNVSSALKDSVKIDITPEWGPDSWEYLNINLYPSARFDLYKYIDKEINSKYMAFIKDAFVRLTASEEINGKFQKLLGY